MRTDLNAVSDEARKKRISSLMEWAKVNNIKIGGVEIEAPDPSSGLGLVAKQTINKGDVLMEVPTSMALSVDTPKDTSNRLLVELFDNDKDLYYTLPWWVQMSLLLNAFDQKLMRKNQKSWSDPERGVDMTPWIECLPRKFDTPIHWSEEALSELQYMFLKDATKLQTQQWEQLYQKVIKGLGMSSAFAKNMSFDDFVWGCECARSRAFSGAYSGSAFKPGPYIFTLFLVASYITLGLGTVEQAANGAAVVFCATILKDFVIPKFQKTKRFVICPTIDMANHDGRGRHSGEVAFEYFGNSYSLAIRSDAPTIQQNDEVLISYGARSNDQLLQYYGFVETDNPNDVYIMPPLREWDIEELEKACGRKFGADRLLKLDKAGLLGLSLDITGSDDSDAANRGGGVVVSRTSGIDPAVLQALRALVSSNEEWFDSGKAIGNFAAENSGGLENERAARLAARTAMELELAQKPTSLEEDEKLLKQMMSSGKSNISTIEDRLAVQFRIEKKKVLREAIKNMR